MTYAFGVGLVGFAVFMACGMAFMAVAWLVECGVRMLGRVWRRRR